MKMNNLRNALAKRASAFFLLLWREKGETEKKIKKIYKKVLTRWRDYGILQTERVSPMY